MTPLLSALLPRGIGNFLGIAIPLALIVVAACLRYLGHKSWLRSFTGSFLGFLCYPLAIGLLIAAFASESFGELLAWTMIFGLPILIGIGLLFLAWLVNVAILCYFGGLRAGLITGFVAMPLMWALCFGSGFSLLKMYENKRESLDPADAVARDDYEYLEKQIGPDQLATLWDLALRHQNPRATEIALAKGADVNGMVRLVNNIPQTPLQTALEPLASEAYRAGPKEQLDRKKAMVSLLLRHKADPNLSGQPGEEPLLLAIQKSGDLDLVKSLLDAGARLTDGGGALHAASSSNYPQSPEIVRLLLDAGAGINAPRDRDGWTPLQAAALGLPATLSLLIERGANPRPTPLASPDNAPILIALLASRPDNALALLQAGADPFARTKEGLSAWQLNRNPELRAALEAKGVPREISTGDLVPEDGDTAGLLMRAYRRNTSVFPVEATISSQLHGAGPWDLRVQFPSDPAPVMLRGITFIETKDLGATINGKERNVRNTETLGDKNSIAQMSRTLELLEPFSDQVQLGYSVTFFFEKEEP